MRNAKRNKKIKSYTIRARNFCKIDMQYIDVLEAIHLRLTDLFRNADTERSNRSRFLNDLNLVFALMYVHVLLL